MIQMGGTVTISNHGISLLLEAHRPTDIKHVRKISMISHKSERRNIYRIIYCPLHTMHTDLEYRLCHRTPPDSPPPVFRGGGRIQRPRPRSTHRVSPMRDSKLTSLVTDLGIMRELSTVLTPDRLQPLSECHLLTETSGIQNYDE